MNRLEPIWVQVHRDPPSQGVPLPAMTDTLRSSHTIKVNSAEAKLDIYENKERAQ